MVSFVSSAPSGFAVDVGGVDLVRRSVADVAVDQDEGRLFLLGLELVERCADLVEVVGVVDVVNVPAVGLETLLDVFGEGEVGAAVDRDPVDVVDPEQVVELLVTGQRGGLVRDAFHHVAVTTDRVDVVVEDFLAVRGPLPEPGDRQADRSGDTLAERTGGGLDAGGQVRFRVTGGGRVELAEVLDVFEGDRRAGR